MASLNNYPNLSQLSAKINGPNDCVPTSLIDGLDYLTGKQFDIDAMVTAVYGPNYHGFTSARAFVPYCEAQGVKLFPIDGDNATLVQAMHQQIQHGFPCLLTEPDPYAPLHPDWSHVLSVYREDPGSLTARDPYSTVANSAIALHLEDVNNANALYVCTGAWNVTDTTNSKADFTPSAADLLPTSPLGKAGLYKSYPVVTLTTGPVAMDSQLLQIDARP